MRIEYGCGKVTLKAIADGWKFNPSTELFCKNMLGKAYYARLEGTALVTEEDMTVDMHGQLQNLNKYGGISGDPYDAKKAKLVADMMKAKTHFAPISWALAIIKQQAEAGKYVAFLMDAPWREENAYAAEMRMHLRDRGFKVTHIPATNDQYAHTKVEW